MRRWVQAISTVLYRQRAARRLHQLQLWLGPTPTRRQVQQRVQEDWQQGHRNQDTGRTWTLPACTREALPQYRVAEEAVRQPFPTTVVLDVLDWQPQRLTLASEALLVRDPRAGPSVA